MIVADSCPKCGTLANRGVGRTTDCGDLPTDLVECQLCSFHYWLPKAGFAPSYYSLRPDAPERSLLTRLRDACRGALDGWRGA